jgi:hypothetical protein
MPPVVRIGPVLWRKRNWLLAGLVAFLLCGEPAVLRGIGWFCAIYAPGTSSGGVFACETTFRRIRWVATNGEAVYSHCGSLTVYECRRPNGAPRWRCKDCGKDFSITSVDAIRRFTSQPSRPIR